MRVKEHHLWPLIPGGILFLVGVGLVLDLFETDASRWVVPAIVVGIGIIVMPQTLRRKAPGVTASA